MAKITRKCPKCGQWVSGEVVENVGHKTARHLSKKGGAAAGTTIGAGIGSLLGPVGTFVGGAVGGYFGGQLANEGVNQVEGDLDMDYKFTCPNPNCGHSWTEYVQGTDPGKSNSAKVVSTPVYEGPVSRKSADRWDLFTAIIFFIISGLSFWYCFTHDLKKIVHVEGNLFTLGMDFDRTDINYWWIFLGLAALAFLGLGINVISQVNFSSFSSTDFVIKRVDVGIVDQKGKTIVGYGKPIYHSKTRFLQPRLCLNVVNEGRYDVYYNLYCNGELSIGDSSTEYTAGQTCDFYSNTTSYIMSGWGGNNPGNWPVGKYRFEFFYRGKKVGFKNFEVLEG